MKSSNRSAVAEDSDTLIRIGKIIGVHGLKGAVKVYSYAESEAHFVPQSDLVLMDDAGHRNPYKVAGSNPHKNIRRIALVGVTTRDQAQALVGNAVMIHRADLPALEENTYYWADLLGMKVFTIGEDYLGRVTEIIATGANDVYVVNAETEAGPREILIPALASVVLDIDIKQRRMSVELPEGLE